MLTPNINDKNREAELKRRELEPDRFAGAPLQGKDLDEANAKLAKQAKDKK